MFLGIQSDIVYKVYIFHYYLKKKIIYYIIIILLLNSFVHYFNELNKVYY